MMGKEYFYIWGVYEGRKVALGPYVMEAEAQEEGHRQMPGFFEVVPLPTAQLASATRMLKARDLDGGANLGDVLQRVKHKLD